MESLVLFEEKVALTPRDINSVVEVNSIDMKILDYLKKKLEKKCIKDGYVIPDTLRLLSRSNGIFENGRFTANIIFNVQAQCRVYNPTYGTVLEGRILKKNYMGLLVVYEDAIRILVPRDLHIGDDDYESLQVGEVIRIHLRKSEFQINDPLIMSVGVYRGRVGAALETGEEEEEELDAEENSMPNDAPAEDEESPINIPEEEGEEEEEEGEEEGEEEATE
jgi:DNA-directed RNA polymerase subunit E'/Rpb7